MDEYTWNGAPKHSASAGCRVPPTHGATTLKHRKRGMKTPSCCTERSCHTRSSPGAAGEGGGGTHTEHEEDAVAAGLQYARGGRECQPAELVRASRAVGNDVVPDARKRTLRSFRALGRGGRC